MPTVENLENAEENKNEITHHPPHPGITSTNHMLNILSYLPSFFCLHNLGCISYTMCYPPFSILQQEHVPMLLNILWNI